MSNEELNKKKYYIKGKFYLKSGVVIEDRKIEPLHKEKAEELLIKMREKTEEYFSKDECFYYALGKTIVRGSDLAAVELEIIEE